MSLDKRFRQIFDNLIAKDYGSALTLICPLIDKAGKEIFGLKNTGKRFKKIINDNQEFLYWVMSNGGVLMTKDSKLYYDFGHYKTELPGLIYKLVRNNLLHEAEISDQILFVKEIRFGPQPDGTIVFPINLIWSMALMLTYLPCYERHCPSDLSVSLNDVNINFKDCWGDKDKLLSYINKAYKK
ncbi:MAG: hypothetical protein AB2795_18930 [Candidatus Thiodiazotropha endolucinida]